MIKTTSMQGISAIISAITCLGFIVMPEVSSGISGARGPAADVALSHSVVSPKVPRVFTIDGKAMAALRARIISHPDEFSATMALLHQEAAPYLTAEPWTIVRKTSLPPSGDPHDYESQGPYWWPNPDTNDGLPYVRRDGERNPEIEKLTDHRFLNEMTQAVKILSLAWYLTGDQKYAGKATLFLHTWFIDHATRMNPHLKYGQRIPGITDGRDIGIIETRFMGDITDAIGLLEGSDAWSNSHQEGMEDWMRDYLNWLLNSEHGKGEAEQHNNHGTWYDVQVASLALFTGQEDIAKRTIMRVRDERLPGHIEPDGSQPHELARTRSWNYSVMNLQSFFTLATLGEKVGIDLWHYVSSDGSGIRKALDYLASFADPSVPKKWEFKQITEWSPQQLAPLLHQAACKFQGSDYLKLARILEGESRNLNTFYFPCAPSAQVDSPRARPAPKKSRRDRRSE